MDYAQLVPLRPIVGGIELSEAHRIDLVMRGLKGIAMKFGVPVLAVAAAEAEGLRQQRKFNRFRHEFNYERPQEALDQQTPASVYTPHPVHPHAPMPALTP